MKLLLYLLLFIVFIQCKQEALLLQNGMVFIKGSGAIKDFWMDESPVSVAEFKIFIDSTRYITEAEKFGDGGVFNFNTGEWGLTKGANWKYPFGPDSAAAQGDHPVTQVSWNDAIAYCKWSGKRLPTSDEFVFAEKNGTENFDHTYSWGDDFIEKGKYKTNFWQGSFPMINTIEDGFLTTSPIGYFGKNKLGLSDIEGNVWQWCSDASKEKPEEMNQRGGSFLCDPSYCHGFKIGGKASSTAETSLCHVGFRCARSQ